MTFKDKVQIGLLALALGALLVFMMSIPQDKAKRVCKEFCSSDGSEVKINEQGVCICQKSCSGGF